MDKELSSDFTGISTPSQVMEIMREWNWWHISRDDIIKTALQLKTPVRRIAREMGVSETVVRNFKRGMP